MSIIGIGCDIICLKRIQKIVNKFKKKFSKRILSNNELKELCNTKDKINFIAKRFAAKEAVLKCLGTGLKNNIGFKHFELSHNNFGKPKLVFLKQAKYILTKYNITAVHVSISDEKNCIFVVVILEK